MLDFSMFIYHEPKHDDQIKKKHFMENKSKMDKKFIIDNTVGNLYWKDKQGKYLGCNKNYLNMLGFKSMEDIIGKTDRDVFLEIMSEEKISVLMKADQEIMLSGKERTFTEEGVNNVGSLAFYLTKKIPLRDDRGNIIGLMGTSLDITKEKKAKLDKQFIIENTVGNLYWKDKDGAYLGCNKNFSKILGLESCEEIIGKKDKDFLDEKIANEVIKMDQEVIKEDIEKIMVEEAIDAKGEPAFYLTRKIPLKTIEGNIIGVMGTSLDITKERQSEIAKNDFITNMQHDLRTPFTGINGIAQLLYTLYADENPEMKELLDLMIKSCNQWEEIHHRILQTLRVNNKVLIFDTFNIFEEIHKLEETMKAKIFLKKLKFIVKPSESNNLIIKTDRLKLSLILLSLLSNAINFTHEGEINISINSCNNFFEIKITDTGVGIPPDKFEYIFDNFTKLSPSNQHGDNFHGLGCGLYVAQDYAKSIGGIITVQSEVGKGSTFTLSLPSGI